MSAIPDSVQTLLDLYATDLRDVRFGDVDAKTLASVSADVEAASEALAEAQALVDDARSKLQERLETLLQHAQRALAYARVYAEANPTVGAQLDAISLPKPARRLRAEADMATPSSSDSQPARRPRGRPRKTPLVEPTLIALDATGQIALDATGQ